MKYIYKCQGYPAIIADFSEAVTRQEGNKFRKMPVGYRCMTATDDVISIGYDLTIDKAELRSEQGIRKFYSKKKAAQRKSERIKAIRRRNSAS